MTIKEEQVSQQFKRTLYSRIHEVMWSLFLHGKNSFDNLNEVNKKRSQDNLYNRTIMPNSFPIIDIRRKKNTGEWFLHTTRNIKFYTTICTHRSEGRWSNFPVAQSYFTQSFFYHYIISSRAVFCEWKPRNLCKDFNIFHNVFTFILVHVITD